MALRTDIIIAPLPQTPPNVGGLLGINAIIVDPDFGTQIVRATDSTDSANSSMQTSDSSGAPISNINDTLWFFRNTFGRSYLRQFDPVAMQITPIAFNTTGAVCFSNVSPGVFYVLVGSVVTKYTYTLVAGVWTFSTSIVLCDFAFPNALPSGFVVNWNSEFLCSLDDTTFSVGFSAGGQNTGIYICAYQTGHGAGGFRTTNCNTGAVTGDWGPTGAAVLTGGATFPFTLHEVVMTPNPLYTAIGPHGPGLNTTIIWTIATLNFLDFNAGGHKAKGYLHAYPGAGGGQLLEIPYVGPVPPFRTIVPAGGLPAGFYGDRHFGFGRIDVADASVIWSCTGANTKLPYNSAWEGEVFGYDVVSGVVSRACHLFNSFKSLQFIVANGMVVPSRTGKFAAFTSDWLGTLGSISGGAVGTVGVDARGDVFIVNLQVLAGISPSTTILNSSKNPANVGDVVTFTATVSSPADNQPTGTVTLYDGITPIGSGQLVAFGDGSQAISFAISTLLAGSHSLTAAYAGDGSNSPSTSPIVVQIIVPPLGTPGLVIEDGSGVPGANSYGTIAGARLYASNRGIILGTDAAVTTQLILATDYLEGLSYVGSQVLYTQALSWPRQNVLFDPSTPFPTNQIPPQLIAAEYQLVLEQFNGINLQPTVDRSTGGFILEERVDVLTTRYSERVGTTSQPTMPKVTSLLRTLVIPSVALRTLRV